MKSFLRNAKPDTSTSSTIGNTQTSLERAEAEVTKSGLARATASRPQNAPTALDSECETDDKGHVLKPEPDGRYRIVGRRPKKRAQAE
jgi:hypothetical protein